MRRARRRRRRRRRRAGERQRWRGVLKAFVIGAAVGKCTLALRAVRRSTAVVLRTAVVRAGRVVVVGVGVGVAAARDGRDAAPPLEVVEPPQALCQARRISRAKRAAPSVPRRARVRRGHRECGAPSRRRCAKDVAPSTARRACCAVPPRARARSPERARHDKPERLAPSERAATSPSASMWGRRSVATRQTEAGTPRQHWFRSWRPPRACGSTSGWPAWSACLACLSQ